MPDFPPQTNLPPEPNPQATAAAQQERALQIGERVRAARIAAHLTQRQLAGETYSNSYISVVEHGKLTPSLPALERLAGRLGVSHAFLLGEDP